MTPTELQERLHASALALACSAIQRNGLPSTMQDEAALARVCVRAATVLLREQKKILTKLLTEDGFEK